jgi:hypothetical protein
MTPLTCDIQTSQGHFANREDEELTRPNVSSKKTTLIELTPKQIERMPASASADNCLLNWLTAWKPSQLKIMNSNTSTAM